MSNGGRGVGGECDEGRNGNGDKRGRKQGRVKMTMKCKYMEESRKNINLSLLLNIVLLDNNQEKRIKSQKPQIPRGRVCVQGGVFVLPVIQKVFPRVFNRQVRSITETDKKNDTVLHTFTTMAR